MTDRRLYADGAPLDHPLGLYAVHGDTLLWGSNERRIGTSEAARRHGVLEMGPITAGPGTAVVSMLIRDWTGRDDRPASFAQMLRNVAEVKRRLGRMSRPVELGLVPDHRNEPDWRIVAKARLTGASDPEEISPHRWKMTFTMQVLDAFWRDAEPITIDGASSYALRGGSAPIVDPLIMVPGQGPTTRVTIRDHATNHWIAYEGDVPEDRWLRLEPFTETAYIVLDAHAWNGGTEDAAGVTVGPGGFELDPDIDWTSTIDGTRIRAARAY